MAVTDIPDNHTKPTREGRGFARMPELPTSYGAMISVYESSAAMHPHLWLNIREPDDLNAQARSNAFGTEYEGGWHDATAHMTVETAEALIEQLRAAIDGHYHFR